MDGGIDSVRWLPAVVGDFLEGGVSLPRQSAAASARPATQELKRDQAIAETDTLLLTVPNQLGVEYNAHVIEAILTPVAPALGRR